jgi:hypothetical protein
MSKRSSARSSGFAAAGLLLALFAVGCDRDTLFSAQDEAGDQGVVQQERVRMPEVEPGLLRQQWSAADALARRVTGNLTASLEHVRSGPLILAFANGVTMRLESMGSMEAGAKIAPDGQTFGQVLHAVGAETVRLYRVMKEDVEKVAPEGGLCRDVATAFVAVAEYVDGSGEWAFHAASFAGVEPGPNAADDPRLCGVYSYQLGR